MEVFPFTDAEWETVQKAARAVVNAALAEDSALHDSRLAELRAVLAVLRERHADHPTLLETEADFTVDTAPQVALYEQAKQKAVAHEMSTLSIRLSLARVLLEELGQPEAARVELLACREELAADGDEWDRRDREHWSELLAECDRQTLNV